MSQFSVFISVSVSEKYKTKTRVSKPYAEKFTCKKGSASTESSEATLALVDYWFLGMKWFFWGVVDLSVLQASLYLLVEESR